MSICFLFTNHFTDEQLLSVCLDRTGHIEAPLIWRSIEEVKVLQKDARTIVVMSAIKSSVHEVELPWLGERKAALALPYALEEELAQPVSTLHFSFDRAHYRHNKYQVLVTDRADLIALIQRLQALDLRFDALTYDWCALQRNEAVVYESILLVNDDVFQGALTMELANMYLENQPESTNRIMFNDSAALNHFGPSTMIDDVGHAWIAQRLLQQPFLNVCQGDLHAMAYGSTRVRRYYQWSAWLACACVASFLLINLVTWLYVKHQISVVDQSIAKIYHTFFPQGSPVIAPRFRITQWLQHHAAGRQDPMLWTVLNVLGSTPHATIEFDRLMYQSHHMLMTLSCPDFSTLEHFEDALKKKNFHVTQTEAAVEGQRVVATLELTL